MFASIARANDLRDKIEPLRQRELGFAFIFRAFCKAASDGMPLASLGVYRMPMMVTATQYVLCILKVLLSVDSRISDGFHEVWPITRPQSQRSVLLHKRRKLAEAIVFWIPIAFLPLFLEELQVRLVAVVVQMFLTMHPTLVLRKRLQLQQIGFHHLGNFRHGLVLINSRSVHVAMEMKIPVLLILDAASECDAQALKTTCS